MNEEIIRVALLFDKSGLYERGLIRGIIKYSKLSFSPWKFFHEAPTYTTQDKKPKILDKIRMWQPDCIVMDGNFLTSDYKSLGIPIIVSASNRIISNAINIIADDNKIGKLGAQYFIDKGYKNFGYYGTNQIFWSNIRKTSFYQTVNSLNFSFYEFEARLNNEWQNNPSFLSEWMKTLPLPIAIMACSDDFGTQLIIAAKIAQLRIPEDVAILGVDNDEFICDMYDPPMSSIDQDPESVGFEVAKTIRLLLKDRHLEIKYIIGNSFRIITRRSTDIFAMDDKEVIKALQYIQKNAEINQISVEDIVLATSLSRRVLEMRFRKMLNRSVLQEITRVKIDLICQKLIKTNQSINEIAYSMGFEWVSTFSSYFRKAKKMSPKEFRNQFHSE
jgi:LacI family transcriptional regulator